MSSLAKREKAAIRAAQGSIAKHTRRLRKLDIDDTANAVLYEAIRHLLIAGSLLEKIEVHRGGRK